MYAAPDKYWVDDINLHMRGQLAQYSKLEPNIECSLFCNEQSTFLFCNEQSALFVWEPGYQKLRCFGLSSCRLQMTDQSQAWIF